MSLVKDIQRCLWSLVYHNNSVIVGLTIALYLAQDYDESTKNKYKKVKKT